MIETNKRTVRILLVEDNPGDVRLITEGFKRTQLKPQFYIASDGEEALNVLYQETPSDPPFEPELILLDLNLPLMNGHETLRSIKMDERFDNIPVIILTSSHLDSDQAKARLHKADLYVFKPINLNEYFKAIQEIEDFWLHFQERHS